MFEIENEIEIEKREPIRTGLVYLIYQVCIVQKRQEDETGAFCNENQEPREAKKNKTNALDTQMLFCTARQNPPAPYNELQQH